MDQKIIINIIQKEIKQTFRNKLNFKMKKKIFFSKKNKGLANSIIKGITYVAKKRRYHYSRMIVS